MARILIVDDDEIFCSTFSLFIREMGHVFEIAETLSAGLKLAYGKDYDIVFLDVLLPDRSGLEGIREFKRAPSSPEVIIITGQGDTNGPETALKNGAWDYLVKPPAFSSIKLLLGRALEYREKKLRSARKEIFFSEFIVGDDPKLKKCLEIAVRAAAGDGSVFISGETGTGKDLVARAVHLNSSRAKGNLVTVDCTNMPVNLVESLLFGHVKGTFTGADRNSEGMIRQAHGGTLFLDEVGDLYASAQKSLLRVLQEKKFRPLGSSREVACDFRVISATNRDLKRMVEAGHFRRDLYFRLAAFHIHLPPLRDRVDDIKLLTRHYLRLICNEMGLKTKECSKDFLDALACWNWPGNVRELINVLRRAVADVLEERALHPHSLPMDIRIHYLKTRIAERQGPEESMGFPKFREYRMFTESKYLDDLIEASGGDAEKARRLSGISRSGLYNLLKKHRKRLKGL